MSKKRKRTTNKRVIDSVNEFLVSFIVAIFAFLFVSYFIQIGQVNGSSMYSTYTDGDRVLMYKQDDIFDDRDIVAFVYTQEQSDFYDKLMNDNGISEGLNVSEVGINHIKRIVGLPGDEVLIKDGKLYINEQLISQTALEIPNQAYTIRRNKYFVVGDNINNSFDSRHHGPVDFDDIFGNVITNK